MTKFSQWKLVVLFAFLGASSLAAMSQGYAANDQTFRTFVSFDITNGASPENSVFAQGRDGNLYGTTYYGGDGNACNGVNEGCGTVFKIGPLGKLTTLYSFCAQPGCPDGSQPQVGLALAVNGDFYGVTLYTLFQITPEGDLRTLHQFCSQQNCLDGSNPATPLVQATDGNLYGTTAGGGRDDDGTVFRVTPEGTLKTIYDFTGGADGATPAEAFIQGSDGNLYGATVGGGLGNNCGRNGGCGTIFKITLKGQLTTVYDFGQSSSGAYQTTSLVEGVDGNFYGATFDRDDGQIYQLTPAGGFTTLHSFHYDDGQWPRGLSQGTDGLLYGTTSIGGAYGGGTVFNISTTGQLTTLHSFCAQRGCRDGSGPWSAVLQSTNGPFYGMTMSGGTDEYYGTIFGLSNGLGPFVAFVQPFGKIGQIGGILGQGFTGTTAVDINGVPAEFDVVSDTYLTAAVPPGATTGYVTVTTPTGVLKSNVPFRVIQ